MTNTTRIRTSLWILAMFLAIGAVVLGAKRLQSDPVSLETYSAPPEIAGEVRSALSAALAGNPALKPLGRVTLMPNGRLVVTAPQSIQRGVRRIIDDIIQNKPAPTPTIGFDVWVVTATPGAAVTAADLAEVEPALAVIRESRGPLAFALLEKLSTKARSGEEESHVRGKNAELEVGASLRKGTNNDSLVAAKLRVVVWQGKTPMHLEAHTEIRPGELLVAGQSALGGTPSTGGPDKQIYYIVRATL